MADFVPAISIVIPTWNGLDLLQRHLPSVLTEAERWAGSRGRATDVEVIVSDDGSTDGSSAWLAQHYPHIHVVSSAVNQGFAPAANAGLLAARADVIVLLNNDLDMTAGALDRILEHFVDPNLFGVTLRGLDLPECRFSTGGKLGRLRRGFWETWRNYDVAPASLQAGPPSGLWPSFSLVGGFCAVRRSMIRELGGFDPLFAPYYWEDVDLSYRARKRGWRIGFEPRSVVHHAVSVSVRRHAAAFRRASVIHRNRLLFHWLNLDPACLAVHALWAALLVVQLAFKGEWAYHCGLLQALRRLPAVRDRRVRERRFWTLPDRDLELRTAPPAPLPAHPAVRSNAALR